MFTCEVDVILKTLVEDEEVFVQIQFHKINYNFLKSMLFLVVVLVAIVMLSNLMHFYLMQLMDLLFSFLKPDRPHTPLSAGYFSKVSPLDFRQIILREKNESNNYLHIMCLF